MAKPFVIVFVARSGSTALFGHLRKHPDIVMRAEMFGSNVLPDGEAQTDDNRIAFLRKFWAPFAEETKRLRAPWRGFKWQIDQGRSQFTDPMGLVSVMNEFQPRVIVLKRDNILKQAVSSMNARRLMQFTQESGRPTAHITVENTAVLERFKNDKIMLDMEAFDRMIASIKASRAMLEEVSAGFPQVKTMVYEELLRDIRAFLGELCDYIGVDPQKIEGEAYMKITSDDLSKAVENYDDLVAYATNAGLSHYI